MRVRILIFVLILFLSDASAQKRRSGAEFESFAAKIAWQQEQEPAKYRRFSREFIKAALADHPESITNVVSADLESRDKTIGFLQFLIDDHGAVRDLQFRYFDTKKQRRDPRRLAVYHCVFEDGSWWDLRIGLDDTGRIDRLIITDPNFNEALPIRVSSRHFELPFNAGEEWYVLWGGRREDMNYHVTSRSQRNALDLVVRHPYSRETFLGSGQSNEDYYAFRRQVVAPIDGTVIEVINGVEDNVPGEMNARQLTGNTVVIRVSDGEYLLLAHMKKSSIKVSVGESVSTGDPIGLVGNSGNSSEPHLHMQLMTAPDMNSAVGIEMRIRELAVRDGAIARNYSPVRSDTIQTSSLTNRALAAREL